VTLLLLLLLRLSSVVLSLTPTSYHVEFPPSSDNYAVVITIVSNDNSHPYYKYEYDEVPIEGEDDTSIDIPRRFLPSGNYTLEAGLSRWVDGKPSVVEWSDTLTIDEE